jgi:Cu(I)/Ag(I) efflux system membrane fusion protein
METQKPAGHGCLSSVVVLLLGIAIGGGLVAAHVSGLLNPLYHRLGLHAMHEQEDQAAGVGSGGHAGHAGHGGMSMPQQGGGEPSKVPGYSIVKITPERQQLISVRTGKVEAGCKLMSIRAVGIIEPDQERLRRIHTRISGWVTKVHVNFVGQNVKKGDPLLELYSPDLLQTQLDYLLAVESWESQGKAEPQRRLMEATRLRLELSGVPADEIQQLEKTRKARETLQLRADISGRVLERNVREGSYIEPAMDLYRIADLSVVWLQAKIYEYEIPHVELDQPVHVTVPTRPDLTIDSNVSFIEPVVSEATRTVKVRVALDNAKDQFKPGMYADLLIEHNMGHGLLVPESAVLRTGERTLAFRLLPDYKFEPVEVKLGSRFGDNFEVLDGLYEGEEIVTSAGFLIDAESRLKSATSAMGGHQHGSSNGQKQKPAEEPKKDPHQGHRHEH